MSQLLMRFLWFLWFIKRFFNIQKIEKGIRPQANPYCFQRDNFVVGDIAEINI